MLRLYGTYFWNMDIWFEMARLSVLIHFISSLGAKERVAREDLLQATMEAQESASKAAVLEQQVKQLQVGCLRDYQGRHTRLYKIIIEAPNKSACIVVAEGFLISLDNTIFPICYLY